MFIGVDGKNSWNYNMLLFLSSSYRSNLGDRNGFENFYSQWELVNTWIGDQMNSNEVYIVHVWTDKLASK